VHEQGDRELDELYMQLADLDTEAAKTAEELPR
jgi:hypothetical protein